MKRIQFAKKYQDDICLDIGSWIEIKSSQLGLAFDILNNLPLQAYNYEYKYHEDLTPCALFFNPMMLYQAIETVMTSVVIRSGVEEDGVLVRNKKELAKAIIAGHKKIYTVKPKCNSPVEQARFCQELCGYVAVIERYIYTVARKRMFKMFGVMMGGSEQ